MNREQKSLVIEDLRSHLKDSQASFLIDYKGLSVSQLQNLRSQLREKGSKLQVAKVRLMKRAVQDVTGVDAMQEYMKEQLALVFATQEPSAVAKILAEFSKKTEALELVVGCFDAQLLDKDAIKRIANLPPKEVLMAQLCGAMQAPATKLAMVLKMIIMQLLFAIKELEQKKH